MKSVGFILGKQRFKCPTCGLICASHVNHGLLGRYCTTCKNYVITYNWNSSKSKWEQG